VVQEFSFFRLTDDDGIATRFYRMSKSFWDLERTGASTQEVWSEVDSRWVPTTHLDYMLFKGEMNLDGIAYDPTETPIEWEGSLGKGYLKRLFRVWFDERGQDSGRETFGCDLGEVDFSLPDIIEAVQRVDRGCILRLVRVSSPWINVQVDFGLEDEVTIAALINQGGIGRNRFLERYAGNLRARGWGLVDAGTVPPWILHDDSQPWEFAGEFITDGRSVASTLVQTLVGVFGCEIYDQFDLEVTLHDATSGVTKE